LLSFVISVIFVVIIVIVIRCHLSSFVVIENWGKKLCNKGIHVSAASGGIAHQNISHMMLGHIWGRQIVRKQGGGKSRDITGLCDLGKGARATVPGGLDDHYRQRQWQRAEKRQGKEKLLRGGIPVPA
jgi:hypothetical protein